MFWWQPQLLLFIDDVTWLPSKHSLSESLAALSEIAERYRGRYWRTCCHVNTLSNARSDVCTSYHIFYVRVIFVSVLLSTSWHVWQHFGISDGSHFAQVWLTRPDLIVSCLRCHVVCCFPDLVPGSACRHDGRNGSEALCAWSRGPRCCSRWRLRIYTYCVSWFWCVT